MLHESYRDWNKKVRGWSQMNFMEIDIEEINKSIEFFMNNLILCKKVIPVTNEIYAYLERSIREFSNMVPIITALRNPLLRPNNFEDIFSSIHFRFDIEDTTIDRLMKQNIYNFKKKIMEISI